MPSVIHNERLNAVKVGIANRSSSRVARFGRYGWRLVATMPVRTGSAARKVEQTVLKNLRSRGCDPFLDPFEIGSLGGSTETFSASLVTPEDLAELVRAEASRS